MKTSRTGFTMIEILFVMIILGILAAVSLPKFVGVSEESKRTLCSSAIGTMNRTVGLTLWSKSLSEGREGEILLDKEAMVRNLPDYNAKACGAIVGLVPGEAEKGDGEYGSPRFIHDGNKTHAPKWEWIQKTVF